VDIQPRESRSRESRSSVSNSGGRPRRTNGDARSHRTLADAAPTRLTLPVTAIQPRDETDTLEAEESPAREATRSRAVVPVRQRKTSLELPHSGGLLVPGSGRVTMALTAKTKIKAPLKHRLPLRILGYMAAVLVVGLAFVAPSLTSTATASACDWYTVKPGDTIKDISASHATTPGEIGRANHLKASNPIYVGQRMCMPTTWWAQAQAQKYVAPVNAQVALPPGIWAGEPCTADRSIVWTIPVSRWAVPPGCFGLIYHPNPRDYMVNGQVIPGFGWCNWWPEALLRNAHVLDWPGHAIPRVGFPVWYAPLPGQHLGHYAFVESIGSGVNTGWLLISEMNMYWRGGGWAAVDYRYIRVDYPNASYLYPN